MTVCHSGRLTRMGLKSFVPAMWDAERRRNDVSLQIVRYCLPAC